MLFRITCAAVMKACGKEQRNPSQALVTRKGPVQNFLDFAADPAANNVFALLSSR
jgi:hypothetical protein